MMQNSVTQEVLVEDSGYFIRISLYVICDIKFKPLCRYNDIQIHFERNRGSSKKFFYYNFIRSFLSYYYYLSLPAVVPKHVWAAAELAMVPTIHLAKKKLLVK
jgi:hypothetical protein